MNELTCKTFGVNDVDVEMKEVHGPLKKKNTIWAYGLDCPAINIKFET